VLNYSVYRNKHFIINIMIEASTDEDAIREALGEFSVDMG
jgi:hypothetical protein